jgi:hypothetical protein
MNSALKEANEQLKSLNERYTQSPFKEMPETQRNELKNMEKKCLTEKVTALNQAILCYTNPDKAAKEKPKSDTKKQHEALSKDVKKELHTLEASIKQKQEALASRLAQEEKRIKVDDAVFNNASKSLTTQYQHHRANASHTDKTPKPMPELHKDKDHHKGHRL